MSRHSSSRGQLVAAMLCMLAVSAGCSTLTTNLTLVSSKPVSIDVNKASTGSQTEASDYRWMIIFFTIGSPNLQNAIDKAIESAGPEYDALIDVTVLVKTQWFILTGKMGYEVRGTPVISSEFTAEEMSLDNGRIEEDLVYYSSREKQAVTRPSARITRLPLAKLRPGAGG